MILSDASIREELAKGRIIIDPLDDRDIQPSSVDLRVDRFFRVFRNDTTPYIDPKQLQEDLTELVEVADGKAFILHPGEFVLGSTLEIVTLPDDLVARLEGKALAVDTPVPTPYGWRTMADLSPGDVVFDSRGGPTVVMAATDVMMGRPCRMLVFSDGESIIADVDHIWRVCDKNGRRRADIRRYRLATTAELERRVGVHGERNYQIELAGPVRYPERPLPIHPYVLGIWLGDGTSTKAEITCADQGIVEHLRATGCPVMALPHHLRYTLGVVGRDRDHSTGCYRQNRSISSALRRLGLLGAKHVPTIYLQGSVEQRTALLQGLMDSDGYVDDIGRCEFSSTNELLAEGVRELAASLGFRPVVTKDRATLRGIDCGPRYRVRFTPHRPVFRLARKAARQAAHRPKHLFRSIVEIREVPSVPVRCIQVSAPDGMFLVGRSFIPTHNSSLGRLGLLIHSSLPGSEPVVVRHGADVEVAPIELVVRKQLEADVVAFDPGTLEVGFHPITGWFEGPPDRIYEVRLTSGRAVRVTAGHNLFTRNEEGRPSKIRTAQLQRGMPIAVPGTAREHAVAWDLVREVIDTGEFETIFDLEVRPDGRHVENFVAGSGGVFVSNTAGFVDAGWSGHLTLELSNVANLPIAIYPGMKIGQISFIRMTSPAENPYGSRETRSKYQGQRGPTPSRYYLNFQDEAQA